ncbi:LLM class flavin-dependent oxidoreductase [Paenibacillus woosongensis]|uniref:LLM class flavin-dependent oxidoreductase n=1 Tax=Paenibacillus woosongensis TaxID=307580 RepID=A0AA95I8U2_9BACL|nr:LLM class flavin-dependent oxidoreductase [Paenibacillus woosongensis]WHX50077.1 LLM class flavin-dependent oxidoreductase [Paenibacillus woosongensis]
MVEFEFGVYSLGERISDASGNIPNAHSRVEAIIQMAKMADEAGLDIFGVGEHHRLDFVTSSYAMLLAAIARETKNIKLTSTLSVISTADPVRVYEDFATLDLLSNGRTEIIVGRGAFLESFSLFGESLDDYDELFDEKLHLFMKLQEEEVVSWQGKFRSSLQNAQIAPRPVQKKLPLWIGVGGTPASAVRAGRLGVNMALGLLSGRPESSKPLVDLYWQAAREAGHDLSKLRVSVSGHSYIAQTGEQAITEFVSHYNQYFGYFLKERGQHFRTTEEELTPQRAAGQILAVGSAEELAEKILHQHELFGHSRFMGQFDLGGQPLSRVEKAMDLLANKVAPMVRRALSK